MMRRYQLTEEHYTPITPELPTNDGKTGDVWDLHHTIVKASCLTSSHDSLLGLR